MHCLKENGKPLYVQIYNALRQQIIERHFSPGSKLPSSRNYAIELGVSRTSVIAAFEQLQAEGYIESRKGSGCYVTPMGSLDTIAQSYETKSTGNTTRWSSIKADHQSGSADMKLFPYRQWARCVAKVARESPESLIEVNDPFGDRNLRESIANYLFEWRGMRVSPEQILVTAGSIDALEICIRTLLKENDLVGLEDPGYLPLRNLIKNMGVSPVWLPVNSDGIQIPSSTPKNRMPGLVVLTPSHQFPLGGTMSPARRIEFLNWAKTTGNWIIEDDYDSEFRYAGKPIPALSGFDRSARSIYIGSFAKIFSTGLRLGFMVAPLNLLDDIDQTLNQYVSKASISMQRPLSEFMNNGGFYRHIRKVRRIYAERLRTLIDSLKKELGEILLFEDHHAGMLFAARLPDGYDDVAIAHAAKEEGILISALSTYYSGKNKQSGLLISFCAYENEQIIHNVLKLKNILMNMGSE